MKTVVMVGLCSHELKIKEWLHKKRNCPLFVISLLSFAKTLVWGPLVLKYKPEPQD